MTRLMVTTRPDGALALTAIREARGLTQEQLAVRADLGSSTIYRLEHDRARPRRSTLRLLADALDCEPDDLFQSTTSNGAGMSDAVAKVHGGGPGAVPE